MAFRLLCLYHCGFPYVLGKGSVRGYGKVSLSPKGFLFVLLLFLKISFSINEALGLLHLPVRGYYLLSPFLSLSIALLMYAQIDLSRGEKF